MEEEFERSKRYQHPLALLILDIDNFKTINDTYGHHGGDSALVKISETLKAKTRQSDFPSRFGGEEFVLVLPDTDHDSALLVANKIHDEIRCCAFSSGDRSFSLTVSIGLSSTCAKTYRDWQEMLEDADQALYLAKNSGKDRVESCASAKRNNAVQSPGHP
jgi:diguanylate cyclase (GGDEF)-like protein